MRSRLQLSSSSLKKSRNAASLLQKDTLAAVSRL
jgi:hypothetical protein